MKRLIYTLLSLAMLTACSQKGKHFTVEGHIAEADGSTLYLEQVTLASGVVMVDSARLDSTGRFSLRGKRPGSPEFYRLRIDDQGINLAIDSCETVHVEATLKDISFGYSVEGSGTCDTIRLLCLKMADLERSVRQMAANRNYTLEERDAKIRQMTTKYKEEVKRDFIQDHMGSTASYFACFQTLGGQLLFDPLYDKDDLKWVRAVANAWHEKYPDSPRTQNMVNIVNEGMRNLTPPRQITLDVNDERVKEVGIIDMTFPDILGNEITLSSLSGKVVLLDFTAYSMRGSSERTLEMRRLYEKYHKRGFEIYQVSVDPNRHIWTQCCETLPWVCVYCEEGINADMLKLYQVDQLPYYFLIDRNCDLNARQEYIPNLEQAIEALL